MGTETTSRAGIGIVKGSVIFPKASGSILATSEQDLERALEELQTNKDVWKNVSVDERIAMLDQIKIDLDKVTDAWMSKTFDAKGISWNSFGELEEWIMVGALFRMLRVLKQAQLDIKRTGRPQMPGTLKTAATGQVVVPAFPQTLKDRIVYQGVTGEIWLKPGVTQEEAVRDQAKHYQVDSEPGKVVAVLGAGSLAMLPIGDFLHYLFVKNMVVILKMNPVNDYIGPVIEAAFSALITPGFLKVVYGGADVGTYLCHHPAVDEIHVTGSDKTFDAILFGTDADAARRKANLEPVLDKPLTGELGNISPVIVVPGDWSDGDIDLQATRIASWLAFNAGCNCLTPRMIIQHKGWAQRDDLNAALGNAFDNLPTRKAYYPGAEQRHESVLNAHPHAQLHGEAPSDHLPWTLVTDIDPSVRDDICFRRETFYSQIGETALDAENIPDFIDRAVEFANDTVWGNLVVTLIVHPNSLKDQQVAAAIERAISNLKYGLITVNLFPGLAYTLKTTPFGAHPGNDYADIQSGIGEVNNFLMFENTEKAVFRAPFRNLREPLLFTTKNLGFGRTLAEFESNPSWWNLNRLGIALLRS